MSDLIVRARTDREAFGQLYDAYYSRIFRYCLRRLFIRAVAEDATSEVFLRVASKMRQFSGTTEEDFRRWVYRIATNEVNAHLRRGKRRRDLLESAARASALGADGGSSRPEADIDRLDWPALYQAVLCLKPRDQAVVVLRFFEQMSHEQIAEVLGERPGTVRVALSRALEKLRRRFVIENDDSFAGPRS
jgi:RNA polymerase sigma-70 factor, ECF subfamily